MAKQLIAYLCTLSLFPLLFAQDTKRSVCNLQYPIWKCSGNVARFDGDAYVKIVGGLSGTFGGSNSLNIDFSKDPHITKAVIDTDVPLILSTFAGAQIESIEISGFNKSIRNLCLFADKQKLPGLTHVSIHNTSIRQFANNQLRNCMEINFPISPEEQLMITVEDSTIHTTSFRKPTANQNEKSTVIFHKINVIKCIILKNVVFEDVQEILFEKESLGEDRLLPHLDANNVTIATTYQTESCPSSSSSNSMFHTTLLNSLFTFAILMFLDMI